MNDQARRLHLQSVAHLIAKSERALVRGPDVRGAVGVDSYEGQMRLEVTLMHRRNRESILDHTVRGMKSFCHVALFPSEAHEYIARRLDLVEQPLVLTEIGVKQRRVRVHSLNWVGDDRQVFIFHFNK